MNQALSPEQVEQFAEDGYLVLPQFYDVEQHIEPIRRGIFEIIGFVADQHDVDLGDRSYSPTEFDAGYLELIAIDRKLGGVVYDAVKQLTPFVRLTALERNEELFRQLRSTGTAGIAAGGSGIRIDNPTETTFRAPWHQEYPAQFRSLDGLVLWSPLRAMTPELGPVEICAGSHREGLIKVYSESSGEMGRSAAYALRLVEEEAIVSRYSHAEPLANPGDLVIMDFLTVHQSGENRSNRSRWSMQLRYFNFADPTGRNIDWAGSYAAGRSINDVHPGLHVGNA